MKKCNGCGEVKPLTSFDVSTRDGYRSRCKACRSAEYAANVDAERLKRKLHREAKPQAAADRHARWAAANTAHLKSYQDAYRARNKAKKSAQQRTKRAERTAMENARRARKINATPAWANIAAINSFYESADALRMLVGEWYEVDHIVPLQSKLVCGLHVEANLQILTESENIAKGNRTWPGMWGSA